MRRHAAILHFALGSLARRAGRNLALAIGLGLVVALFASTVFLADAVRWEYRLLVDRMPDLTVQRMVGGRPALLEAAQAEALRDIPAVRSVRPRVWGYLFFAALEGNVAVVGVDGAEAFDGATTEGRLPRRAGEVAVGSALGRLLGLRVGDELGLPVGDELTFSDVVGAFDERSALRSADLIVATPEYARTLLGLPAGMATDLALDLTTPDEAPVVTRRIDERIPGARVLDRRLLRRTYELTFDARSGLTAALLVPALAAFLLLAWERLTGLGAAERREIGVLKAVGWGTGDVLLARLYESAALALGGTAGGLVVAYLYVFLLGAPGLTDALLGWSNLYAEVRLTPAVSGSQLATLIAAVGVPYLAVSLVPAWRAAVLDPDRALRGGR
ncbi:MAG: ABC transporter permease [Sandaracinaceae bacterium]